MASFGQSKHPFSASTPSLATPSISTFYSSSECSTSTSSSSSTVPGPGALSGKAILALGKVTLRGAEYLVIQRRLRTICSKFPHTNTANIRGIEQIYDDILELSRYELYSDTIRSRVFPLLLWQIGSRQTRYLLMGLRKWPPVEIKIFISGLTSILDPLHVSTEGNPVDVDELVQAYRGSLAAWESHSFEPLIDFICQTAQLSHAIRNAVLEGGTLELLLNLYVSNFRDPLAETDRGAFDRKSSLLAACNFFLTICSDDERGLHIICGHPIHVLWSTRPQLSFTNLVRNREDKRVNVWMSARKEILLWRIHSTFDMMLDWTRTYDEGFLYDVCVDLLELSGSAAMDLEISVRALRTLHRFISRINIAQRLISRYLALSTTEHFIGIMSRIVRLLSLTITFPGTPHTPVADFFFLRWDKADFKVNSVIHFIHCFFTIAKTDDSFMQVALATNMLGLLRPFLEMELRGKYDMARHEAEQIMVYDQQDFDLLQLIREGGLENLLPGGDSPTTHEAAYRRSVLSRAFDVFLRRGDHHPFPELLHSGWDELPSSLDTSDFASFWVS